MGIDQTALDVLDRTFAWRGDWGWGLPLIVLTVLIHVTCLGMVGHRLARFYNREITQRHQNGAFIVVTGVTTLLASCLHGIEAGIWAAAYWLLGVLPDFSAAMLYSLNAMTSYGHTSLTLTEHWNLMGALEALNGWLLFGLTTAFLFAVIQKAWFGNSK